MLHVTPGRPPVSQSSWRTLVRTKSSPCGCAPRGTMRPVSPYMAHTTVRWTGPVSSPSRRRERAAAIASAATAGPLLSATSSAAMPDRPSSASRTGASAFSIAPEDARAPGSQAPRPSHPRDDQAKGSRLPLSTEHASQAWRASASMLS